MTDKPSLIPSIPTFRLPHPSGSKLFCHLVAVVTQYLQQAWGFSLDGGGFIQAPPLVSKVPILLPKYPMGQRQLRHSCSETSNSPAPRAPPVVLLVLRTPKRQVGRLLDQSQHTGTGKVDLTSSGHFTDAARKAHAHTVS